MYAIMVCLDGKMIDGGRAYIRSTGLDGVFKISDGNFEQVE